MKTILALSLLFISAIGMNPLYHQLLKDSFSQWKLTYNRQYTTEYENDVRFVVFAENFEKILTFNQNQSDIVLGLNEFADMTSEEFERKYTGYIPEPRDNQADVINVQDLPEEVDWRSKGAVTKVKSQGSCGSCWAFSATGALEGFYFINSGKLLTLSNQNLVDCVVASYGCNGGLMTDAFEHTGNVGIETEEDYPYVGRNQKCTFNSAKAVQVNTGYVNVPQKSAVALKTALVNQPVSVAIQASSVVFQFYKSGVIKKLCGDKLNHGVLAVGYGIFNGVEAYIVKNSWGVGWGQEGYVYISSDDSANKGYGVCGILKDACYPKN